MCTSACVAMGIAMASGRLDPCKHRPNDSLAKAMELGGISQGVIELSIGSGSPTGAAEAISLLGIDVLSIGILVHEYVILLGAGPAFGPPVVSCIISAEDLPGCIAERDRDGKGVACILTSSGHSTCIMHQGCEFSFFDPGPSLLVTGLRADEVLCTIRGIASATQCDATLLYRQCP